MSVSDLSVFITVNRLVCYRFCRDAHLSLSSTVYSSYLSNLVSTLSVLAKCPPFVLFSLITSERFQLTH